jgi:threonine dehydratase
MIPLEHIRGARDRIASYLHHTPLQRSHRLGDRISAQLWLKCESLQKTGSFKPRGALNKVLSLDTAERQRGLITVSAGNHAQAVAWAAEQVGAPCVVVMPSDAPRSKVAAVRGYGGEIVSHDDRATLFDRLEEEQRARGSTFVHPFDDPVVLAGSGTLGLEIIEECPTVETIVVPVGGGGLLGGVTSAVKATRGDVRVVAVELDEGPGLGPALEAGEPIPVARPAGTLADGMTPPFVGALPLQIAREAVDEVVTVTEREIEDAMILLMTRCKLYVEGSGAAATAALLSGKVTASPGERIVSVVSGGNVDVATVAARLGGMR